MNAKIHLKEDLPLDSDNKQIEPDMNVETVENLGKDTVNVTTTTSIPQSTKHEISSYVKFMNIYARSFLLFCLIFTIGIAVYAFGIFSSLDDAGWLPPKAESTIMEKYFGQFDNITQNIGMIALMESSEFTVHDPQFRAAYEELKSTLEANIPVSQFISYFDYSYMTNMISIDDHKAYATALLPDSVMNYQGTPPYTYDDFENCAKGNILKVTFAGNYISQVESDSYISTTLASTETGAAPVLIVLLLFAFNGVAAMTMPLLLIVWNIIVTFTILRLVSLGFHMTTYVTDVTFIFGAGLAIDFSLFMHLRFTEEMNKRGRLLDSSSYTQEKVMESVDVMMKTSGRTIAFSAILLSTTLVGALQFHEYFLTTMSLAIIVPALSAALGGLTIFPALYLWMGNRMFYGSMSPLTDFLTAKFRIALAKTFPNSQFQQPPEQQQQQQQQEQEDREKQVKQVEMTKTNSNDNNHNHNSNNHVIPYQPVNKQEQLSDLENQLEEANNNINTTNQQRSQQLVIYRGEDAILTESNSGELQTHDNIIKPDTNNNNQIIEASDSVKKTEMRYPEADLHRQDLFFQTVIFAMKYPWPFIIVIGGCLVAMLWVFVTQVKFANQSFGGFPLYSHTRYVIETILDDFPQGNGKQGMTVYMQTTKYNDVQSEEFINFLFDFCQDVNTQVPHVVDVTSIVTTGDNKTLPYYLHYYEHPFEAQNLNVTHKLISPFHLTDFHEVAIVMVSTNIVASDNDLGKTVRALRHLVDREFSEATMTAQDGSTYPLFQRYGVGGELAQSYDVDSDIINTLPSALVVILVAMTFFIILLTGSIVLAFKAILCAGLSICASFGFLVLVIQEGNGDHFLQFRNNLKCLDPLQLTFIFIVAFGLSLDYEVFLLGRIQEIYEITHNNQYAVAKGISSSGLTITLAAALLCTAIGGFVASDLLLFKQIGMGIGLTIILDATVVRCLLVPALMSVLGEWNWYAPDFIKKPVKYFNIQH